MEDRVKWLWRRTALVSLMASITLTGVSACSGIVSCASQPVQTALQRAIDKLYAQSRQLADVQVKIADIIVVQQTSQSATCRAAINITVDYLGTRHNESAIATFVAERTESGDILVTIRE